MLWDGAGGRYVSPPGRDGLDLSPLEGVRAGSAAAWPPRHIPCSGPSSQEPSPYDESEVHDSFHQLIQEQSRWVAEEGLQLQQRQPETGALGAAGEPTWPGH